MQICIYKARRCAYYYVITIASEYVRNASLLPGHISHFNSTYTFSCLTYFSLSLFLRSSIFHFIFFFFFFFFSFSFFFYLFFSEPDNVNKCLAYSTTWDPHKPPLPAKTLSRSTVTIQIRRKKKRRRRNTYFVRHVANFEYKIGFFPQLYAYIYLQLSFPNLFSVQSDKNYISHSCGI